MAMDSAMTTRAEREQLNALAVEGSWLLGANSTTMLRVERDTQPPTRPALPRAERTLKRSPTPAFTHTALTPVIEPPDMPAAIGRLVYRGRSGAVVPFTAEMLETDVPATPLKKTSLGAVETEDVHADVPFREVHPVAKTAPSNTGRAPLPHAPKVIGAPAAPDVGALRTSRHRSPRRNNTVSPGCRCCALTWDTVCHGVLVLMPEA